MSFLPVGDYGVIGDLHTAALIGRNGSIDWLCAPRFDSPSVFAALLDDQRGGRWCIAPTVPATTEHRYLPGTNILVTTFRIESGGVLVVTDFMPAGPAREGRTEIHRRVQCTRGACEAEVVFEPRFDYGTRQPVLARRACGVLATDAEDDVATLSCAPDVSWQIEQARATARLSLATDEAAWFVLRCDDDEVYAVAHYRSQDKLDATARWWDEWSSRLQYQGPYRQEVERSALALKLCCYEPSGAIIAAPTTSLPETPGGGGAQPVRVGNGAAQQFQLDVYGELLDTVDIWRRHHAMTEGVWKVLQHLVDWTATHWREPDLSIWEPRQEPKHFVFSKVMAWVALNRGARIAADLGLPGDTARWQREAELVHAEVLERGWDPVRQTFVQVYGEPQLDAALLVIPKVRFLPRADPRVRSTIAAVRRELATSCEELIYRYKSPDGMGGDEGAFLACSFWLAQTLAMAGDFDEGERLFHNLLRRANPLGLFAEEIDPATGEQLGNFPQGLSHAALINTAYVLERLRPKRD